MTRPLSASDLIYVNLVTAAMGRAYLAAEIVAADHPEFSIEVYLADAWDTAPFAELPPIDYLVMDTGPGCSRGGRLAPNTTTTEMVRDLQRAAKYVATELARLNAEVVTFHDDGPEGINGHAEPDPALAPLPVELEHQAIAAGIAISDVGPLPLPATVIDATAPAEVYP